MKRQRTTIEILEQEAYLTRAEVAAVLRCDVSSLYNLVRRGQLRPPFGIGGRVLYRSEDVRAALIPLDSTKINNEI